MNLDKLAKVISDEIGEPITIINTGSGIRMRLSRHAAMEISEEDLVRAEDIASLFLARAKDLQRAQNEWSPKEKS